MEEEQGRYGARMDELLARMRSGDDEARSQVFGLLYSALRGIAERLMRDQDTAHTLQPTALLNEACLRMLAHGGNGWKDEQHFVGFAVSSMRSVLVDHARGKHRQKRSPPGQRVSFEVLVEEFETRSVDLLALDAALGRLAEVDERLEKLVELRFFAGFSIAEAAKLLGMSERQAHREWCTARAWLRRELE